MEVIFDKGILTNALTPLMYTVSNKNTMATIEGVHIVCNENDEKCLLETQDMEKGIRTYIPCQVKEPGNVIINAVKLSQMVKVMPEGDIKISVDDNLSTRIETSKSHFDIKALSGEDFPPLPEVIGERGFIIPQQIFKKLVNKISFAISQNDPRPVFNGAFFKITEGKIVIVACDGNRLAYCEKTTEIENRNKDGTPLNLKFIVPGKTLNDLLRIIKDSEENMEIKVSRRYIAFNIGDSSFFSKTIDAEYIDYNRILPTKHTVVLKLKAEDLRGALERSSLIVEDRLAGSIRSYVKLTVEERLMVSTTSASGNVYDEINIEKESNGNIVIGFNCRFILDALRACDDGDVKMSFNNPLMGVLIEPQSSEDGKFLYFVMPIRMNS